MLGDRARSTRDQPRSPTRRSKTADRVPLPDAVHAYRAAPRVERNFSRLKGRPLGLRPFFVRREDYVKGLVRLLSLALRVLTLPEINGRSILSTEQVYDYIAGGGAEGSPVMRYLEEAGLELKCLAFKDFDFTNPEGRNHCEECNIEVGSGIELP